jgi:hypothetical protein
MPPRKPGDRVAVQAVRLRGPASTQRPRPARARARPGARPRAGSCQLRGGRDGGRSSRSRAHEAREGEHGDAGAERERAVSVAQVVEVAQRLDPDSFLDGGSRRRRRGFGTPCLAGSRPRTRPSATKTRLRRRAVPLQAIALEALRPSNLDGGTIDVALSSANGSEGRSKHKLADVVRLHSLSRREILSERTAQPSTTQYVVWLGPRIAASSTRPDY